MATYDELFDLRQNPSLLNKLTVGIADAAVSVLGETAGPNIVVRQDWAKVAIKRPKDESPDFIWSLLIANKAATPSQILEASDTAILANVNTAIDDRFGAAT